jgi:hypothetical protein
VFAIESSSLSDLRLRLAPGFLMDNQMYLAAVVLLTGVQAASEIVGL